jgi:hypothetical protein
MAPNLQTAIHGLDLAQLDAAVEDAIGAGDPQALHVLGYGEITLVLGWPSDEPVVAVKRLPPFRDRARFEAYAGVLDRYVAALRDRGVAVLDTDLRSRPAPDGSLRAYLVQPLVPRATHLNVVLGHADDGAGAELIGQVADNVRRCVGDRVGLDAQAANWFLDDGGLACFDVSTPMLRGDDGREQIDFSVFLSIYPWLARPLLARIAPPVMAQYHDPRTVLLDFASNLHKEGLDRWVPALIEIANGWLDRPLREADVRRYFRQDRLLWSLMQRLRLADRAWQRRVRRRRYPFLLPPRYRYGPPTRPQGRIP